MKFLTLPFFLFFTVSLPAQSLFFIRNAHPKDTLLVNEGWKETVEFVNISKDTIRITQVSTSNSMAMVSDWPTGNILPGTKGQFIFRVGSGSGKTGPFTSFSTFTLSNKTTAVYSHPLYFNKPMPAVAPVPAQTKSQLTPKTSSSKGIDTLGSSDPSPLLIPPDTASGTIPPHEMPYFPGATNDMESDQMLRAYVQSKLNRKLMDTSGTVWVQFEVSKTGKVSKATIRRGLNPKIDQEVLRVFAQMPDWMPGHCEGAPGDNAWTYPCAMLLNFPVKIIAE